MSNYNRGNGNQQKNRQDIIPLVNPDIEKALLGALLYDGNLLAEVKGILGATDFYREVHNWIYQAMLALEQKGVVIDFVTLTEELERSNKANDIGGAAYLAGLMAEVPNTYHAVGYARKIKDLAWRREINRQFVDILRQVNDTDNPNPLETTPQVLEYLRAYSPSTELWRGKTATEIIQTEYPAPRWVLHGMLPEGLTIIAGRAKLGKSWLALQIARAVGTGGDLFGESVTQGKVLYCALEDSERRIKDRMTQQGWVKTDNVSFLTELPPITREGLGILQTSISADGYALTIIDTVSRNLGLHIDQNESGAVTSALASLQRLALETNSAIVLIDHHNKAASWRAEGDAIADIFGSVAKGASADAIWGLYRDRTSADATLKIAGRDFVEQELALSFGDNCQWELIGDAREVARNKTHEKILDAIKFQDGEATNKEIAEITGIATSHVSRALGELLAEGKVKRGEKQGRVIPYLLEE